MSKLVTAVVRRLRVIGIWLAGYISEGMWMRAQGETVYMDLDILSGSAPGRRRHRR